MKPTTTQHWEQRIDSYRMIVAALLQANGMSKNKSIATAAHLRDGEVRWILNNAAMSRRQIHDAITPKMLKTARIVAMNSFKPRPTKKTRVAEARRARRR